MIRSSEENLHGNIYLKRFFGQNGKAANMLFDPGTKLDMTAMSMMEKLCGEINNTNAR